MLEREPPALPPDYIYTSHWCEENIYKLIAYFNSRDDCTAYWDIFAVFISNPSRSVALWSQKSANAENDVVLWDYHVVMILIPRSSPVLAGDTNVLPTRNTQSWVYDLDTRLPVPCVASEYIRRTFLHQRALLDQYASIFRVIQADKFLDNFASDRSHMLILGDTAVGVCQYIKPPPPYPPICGKKAGERNIANNLMSSFVTMVPSDKMYGVVLDFSAFETWALQ